MMDFTGLRIKDFTRIVLINMKSGTSKIMCSRTSEGIIAVKNGSLMYKHNGIEFKSDKDHILIIPRGITYSFTSTTDSLSYVINFNLERPFGFDTIISVRLSSSAFASRMERLWMFRPDGYELKCLSIMYSFFADISREDRYAAVSKAGLIKDGIKYMEDNFLDPGLRDNQIAEACSISKTYFRSIFSKIYGMPPARYIRLKRIERAKQILEAGYYDSICDVAAGSGFGDIFTFCKVFRKETGLTPTEYAKLTEKK